MIEVKKIEPEVEQPEITAELAMSAINIIKTYCVQQYDCDKCKLGYLCNKQFKHSPCRWAE